MKITLIVLVHVATSVSGCRYDEFRCSDGQCIPEEYAYDSEYLDCDDCSDELRSIWDHTCFRTPTTRSTTTKRPPPPPPPPSSPAPVPHTQLINQIKLSVKCGVQSYQPDLNPAYPLRIGRYADNAKQAQRHSWPWQVLIAKPGRFEGTCGGTIVAPDLVVTAAHCAEKWADGPLYEHGSEFCVWAGLHSRSDKDVPCKLKGKLHVHQSFQRERFQSNYASDIALLKLNKKLQFNDKVKPVCLAESAVEPGTECYVTGWGKEARKNVPPTQWPKPDGLTQAMQIIQPCKYRQNRNMVCAKGPRVNKPDEPGAQNESTCNADSGGPLVCKSNSGQWVLHGVVSGAESLADGSTNKHCGSGNAPNVGEYASVLHHREFITSYGFIQRLQSEYDYDIPMTYD